MRDLNLKIKLIFIPYLVLSAGFVVLYTFLHWWLVIKQELVEVEEMMIDYWIPVGLILILLVVVRKRIRLMNLTNRRGGDFSTLYYIIAMLTMMVPTIIAQEYIRTSTGKLSRLASVEQFDFLNMTKYYQFEKIYLDKRFTGIYWSIDISGKYNSTMNFHAFFAVPVRTTAQDTLKPYSNVWYGFEYRDQISNRKEESEKAAAFRKFQQSSLEKYRRLDLYQYVYLDRIGLNDLQEGLHKAVNVMRVDQSLRPILLKPVNEPFESRNGRKLEWMLGSYVVLSLIGLLLILYPTLRLSEIKD